MILQFQNSAVAPITGVKLLPCITSTAPHSLGPTREGTTKLHIGKSLLLVHDQLIYHLKPFGLRLCPQMARIIPIRSRRSSYARADPQPIQCLPRSAFRNPAVSIPAIPLVASLPLSASTTCSNGFALDRIPRDTRTRYFPGGTSTVTRRDLPPDKNNALQTPAVFDRTRRPQKSMRRPAHKIVPARPPRTSARNWKTVPLAPA